MSNVSLAGVVLGLLAGIVIPMISNTLFFWLVVGLAPVIALAGAGGRRGNGKQFQG
ncbi:MAG TPA: hypothetical protein VE783_07310 [Candidatus Limnocylindrales bacterium]|jgi:hypothetical protein|nr:hypothetical protein [Candidatus Limnocylindrales bacterium]